MRLAKSGHIGNVRQPNALMTFKEYLEDYASEETKKVGEAMIVKDWRRYRTRRSGNRRRSISSS